MMYIAVEPKKSISILHEQKHAVYTLKEEVDSDLYLKSVISVLKKYKYLKVKCGMIKTENEIEMGKWFGVFLSLNWNCKIIKSVEWKEFFGLYPTEPIKQYFHWSRFIKTKYPMMGVNKDNYKSILVACYLNEKEQYKKDSVVV